MAFTVLHLSHISNYTPPVGYGGIELVVDTLARYQAWLNCKVKVVGVKPVNYQPLYEFINVFNEPVARPGVSHKIRYSRLVFKHSRESDIIHSHVQWLLPSLILLKITGKPVVLTLHSDPKDKMLFRYASKIGITLVAISRTQRERLQREGLKIHDHIYLGVELDKYPFTTVKEDYFIYLGRIDRSKGTHIAVRASRRSGRRLILMGPVLDKDYFNEYVRPYVDGKSVIYLGEVDFDTKVKYLSRARALLYPVQYEEFFGLAMVEALACGTPVIGFARGSVIEIVRHGETGFTVTREDEFEQAMSRVDTIDPNECRRDVEQRFSATSMVSRYLDLYDEIVSSSKQR